MGVNVRSGILPPAGVRAVDVPEMREIAGIEGVSPAERSDHPVPQNQSDPSAAYISSQAM
jgi:hypothetical protein